MTKKSLWTVFNGGPESNRARTAAWVWMNLQFRTLAIQRRDSDVLERLANKLDGDAELSIQERRDCARYLRLLASEFHQEESETRMDDDCLIALEYMARLKLAPRRGWSDKLKYSVGTSWGATPDVVEHARKKHGEMLGAFLSSLESRLVGRTRVIRRDPVSGLDVPDKWTREEFYKQIVCGVQSEQSKRSAEGMNVLKDAELENLFNFLASLLPPDAWDRETMLRDYDKEGRSRRRAICPRCWSVNDEQLLFDSQEPNGIHVFRCRKDGCGFLINRITP